ncbi:MAG: hypothetical protein Q7R76_05515 [Candidatus Woesearchaeota archaeon]|nr:hypothetical protein [Candidatus Woesearchaeota archaeon]
MGKLGRTFKNTRIIIWLIFLVFALVAISPQPWVEGVAIRTVIKDSAAFKAGMESPKSTATPTSREVIASINNIPIKDVDDYYDVIQDLKLNDTLLIRTDQRTYRLTVQQESEQRTVNETVTTEETVNGTLQNMTTVVQKTVSVPKNATNPVAEDIGIKVYPAPTTNLRKGLDLQGGTRVLLKPEKELSFDDMDTLIEGMKQRLNVYGLSDVIIRKTTDLSGNQYILIEIAGATEEEVKNLVGKQGKFEAKIGDTVAFVGGKDITYVCRSAECAGIDPQAGCGKAATETGSMEVCRFRFSISLTPEAAEKHAQITNGLKVVTDNGEKYLEQKLDLYLDDEKVDELNIGAELQGRAVTDISISGSGSGTTREGALTESLASMKRLQTILITGSLPVKLETVKIDTISPSLGEGFIKNSLFVGMLAIVAVGVVVFLRYRKIKISIPIMVTMISEIVLLMGFAAVVGWNLDISAIAGIIIAAGTGVDHQIVIVDELLKGKKMVEAYDWRVRIRSAFFIIMGTYFTMLVAMIPLLFAGAGLIKGFAFTTIVGITMGVLIARPAFAAFIEILMKD